MNLERPRNVLDWPSYFILIHSGFGYDVVQSPGWNDVRVMRLADTDPHHSLASVSIV